jgi:hypothetical protein
MRLTPAELSGLAAETGFQPEPLEKVLNLLELLEGLRSHPFLSDRLVLKGGTALNLFLLAVPRLSVDIDVNYVGALDREVMLAERPRLETAIQAVCSRQGLSVGRMPSEHAGGKWRLRHERAEGGTGSLELDVNFLMRTPLWDPEVRDSVSLGTFAALRIPVVDRHELAAGKLAALFSRAASRDLFDVRALLRRGGFDEDRLRLAFVLYGGMSRRDWRTVSVGDVRLEPREVEQRLLPLLRAEVAPTRQEVPAWAERLVEECRELVSGLLPFTPREAEFLERLNGVGELVPEVLTDDPRLQERIRDHPALLWKALNVRRYVEGGR